MTNFPEIVKTELAKAIGQKSTELTISLRKTLDHQSNRLYDIWTDGCHFIAKEFLNPEEVEIAPLREYKALQLLSLLDLAPQPIYFEPSAAPIVIYKFMEGEMWDRRLLNASDLTRLAEVLLKINSLPADWYSRDYERTLQEIELEFHHHFKNYQDWATLEFKPGQRPAEICLKLLDSCHSIAKELSDYPVLPCFCRGDPRFANVIERPNGQLGLVDWEDSGLRDPAHEIADVITHPNQEDLVSWEEWQAFLIPYLAVHSKRDNTITRRMHLYLKIFPLIWLSIILQHGIKLASTGQLMEWTINGLTVNERLRRYFARALIWPDMDYRNTLENLKDIVFFPIGQLQ